MFQVRALYKNFEVAPGSPSRFEATGEMSLERLLRHVDDLNEFVDEAKSDPPNAVDLLRSGFITVQGTGYVLHIYFDGSIQHTVKNHVTFEFFEMPGDEGVSETGRDLARLSGFMKTPQIKDVLKILDRGESPLSFIERTAAPSED